MKPRILAIGIAAAFIALPRFLSAQGGGGQPLAEAKARFETTLSALRNSQKAAKTRLCDDYTAMLKAAEKTLQDQGALEGVVAIRAEKERFQKQMSVPETDDGNDNLDVVGVRQKYRERAAKLFTEQAREIVGAFQKYTDSLCVLKKQLTKDDKIDAALAVQEEQSRIAKNEQISVALAAVQTADALAAAKSATTSTGADKPYEKVPAHVTGAAADMAKLLDSVKIESLEFSSYEVNSPAGLLTRFAAAVVPKGIGVRLDAKKLGTVSVWYQDGVPRFSLPYRYGSEYGGEARGYNVSGFSAGDALRAMCTVLGLGYKIDPAGKGVVLLDSTASDALWSCAGLSLPDVLDALKTDSSKRTVVGKTIVVAGNVTRTVDGLASMSVDLDNDVRLQFPKDEAGKEQYDSIKSKYAEAERMNRSYRSNYYKTEVVAMGDISAASGARCVVLEKCRVLSTTSRYNYSGDKKAKPKRLGE